MVANPNKNNYASVDPKVRANAELGVRHKAEPGVIADVRTLQTICENIAEQIEKSMQKNKRGEINSVVRKRTQPFFINLVVQWGPTNGNNSRLIVLGWTNDSKSSGARGIHNRKV